MKRNHKLFTFIVHGERTEVDSNTSSSLNAAAQKALEQTANIGRPLEDWNMVVDGKVLNGKKPLSRHRLAEWDVIWLSLKFAGGSEMPFVEQCMCGSITRIENLCPACKKSREYAA